MEFNLMQEKDSLIIRQMLESEGIDTPLHEKFTTFVMSEKEQILGFITVRLEHGFPALQHFMVNKEFREGNMFAGRDLLRFFRNICRCMGYTKAILHCGKNNGREYLRKFIEHYFKVKPYSEANDRYWYLVEV